jgi:hypothetical protein
MEYRGYVIKDTGDQGGKAGHGRDKTASIQVREQLPGQEYLLLFSSVYNIGDPEDLKCSVQKAKEFIDRRDDARGKLD